MRIKNYGWRIEYLSGKSKRYFSKVLDEKSLDEVLNSSMTVGFILHHGEDVVDFWRLKTDPEQFYLATLNNRKSLTHSELTVEKIKEFAIPALSTKDKQKQ